MKLLYLFAVCVSLLSISCSAIKETSKHQMETGIYKVSDQNNKKFFAVVDENKITLYPVAKTKNGWIASTDTTAAISLLAANPVHKETKFITSSFDLDVLSILFKYRPYTAGLANQLNTNFNGAGYLGYRSDYYILSYDKDPINAYQRRMSHFAYSIGLFGGLGSTTMNASVTNNQLQSEYDGVVITKGIVGLIGVGEFTFGSALGFDHLIDKNHKVWIYQGKPWIGFAVGFNIN